MSDQPDALALLDVLGLLDSQEPARQIIRAEIERLREAMKGATIIANTAGAEIAQLREANHHYRDAADEARKLRERLVKKNEALKFLVLQTKWKSVEKDNMEFEGRVTCFQLEKARAALTDEQGEK